jgi:hypothetical protein
MPGKPPLVGEPVCVTVAAKSTVRTEREPVLRRNMQTPDPRDFCAPCRDLETAKPILAGTTYVRVWAVTAGGDASATGGRRPACYCMVKVISKSHSRVKKGSVSESPLFGFINKIILL